MTTEAASKTSSRRKRPPVCGFTFRGDTCKKRGAHRCQPRGDKVVRFFAEVLVHTKGRWARHPFVLEDWQEHEIIRPVFETVVWLPEWECYGRQYRIVWIELGRKNGKSELDAGIVWYLLVADDEEAAEIYGGAKDTKQAGKVAEVVERMRQLSPALRDRCEYNKSRRRVYDERTASYYEVITSDAVGELGHNPHGVVIDEVLAQADGRFWAAMRTAMGARVQPLMLGSTTAGDDPSGFCAKEHEEMERIAADPKRAPHVFVFMRNTPKDADPWDEANWHHANPALGSFLSIQALRDEATEARNDPTKENEFRQYRLNQWVSQRTRWMPLHRWDASAGMVVDDALAGRVCYAGLDLASTTDLAAWVLLFPPDDPDDVFRVRWRFWTPEAQIPFFDQHTGNRASVWVREGLLTATEGDWIDYFGAIHPAIAQDSRDYRIRWVGYDQKEATATAQFMVNDLGLDISPVYQGFGLSSALKEIMRLVKAGQLAHGGHPVARWNADSAEVKRDDQDRLKLVKPARENSGKRIDGIAALANAVNVYQALAADGPVELDGALMA